MGQPLVPDPIAAHDSCVFLRLGQEVFRVTESRLRVLGIRTRHFTVLAVLEHQGPSSQMDLARRTRIDTSTMVAAIDDLEGRGLAVRERDEADRRRSLITITEAGRVMLDQANAVMASVNGAVFADLSAAEARQLTRLLSKINTGGAVAAAGQSTAPATG